MIKICMIVHKNYYQDPRVRRYVESLAKTDAMVDVICLSDNDYSVNETQERIRVYSIPVRHADSSRARYVFEYIYAFVLFLIRLSVLQIRNHYQVIHVHNMPDFLIFSALLPKIMGARLILDIHDPMPEVFVSKYSDQSSKLMLSLISFQEKISCSFADAVITVNIKCKFNLIKRGIPAEKITLIHNYPDPAIFNRNAYHNERQIRTDNFVLIYPGTIAPRYGLETVIRALPELQARIPQICLVIMGPENEYKNELRRLADQLGVSSHVQFRPPVPIKDVPFHLITADIGIYPALKDVHMNVATPTKLMEFAIMGVPIISSRMSMVEEMFGDSEIMFFEPENVNQFAQCVINLYENPGLREEMVKNVDQNFIKKYSWEREFQEYLQVLKQLSPKIADTNPAINNGKNL
jgi:glycosyltransferase involved in cell wall biosynthesis